MPRSARPPPAPAGTNTFPGTRYRRLIRRTPKKKALPATANCLPAIIWHVLPDPAATYRDLGPGYHDQHPSPARQAPNHIRDLERPGYHLTIATINPGTGEPAPRHNLNPNPDQAALLSASGGQRQQGDNGGPR